MIDAIGCLCFATDTKLIVGRYSAVSIGQTIETRKVKAFPTEPGLQVTVDSAKSSEEWLLTVSTGSFDDMDFELIFDQQSQTSASGSIPEFKTVTIPATTPFTVTVTGLDAASVKATILSSEGNIPLTKGAVSATGFTASGTTLTFDEDNAGLTVAIIYNKAYTNLEMIGGPTPDVPYGNLQFFGVIDGPRFERKKIWLPIVSRSSGVDLAFADETTADLEYECLVPPSWSKPYMVTKGALAA
jgi:hypothetical protein